MKELKKLKLVQLAEQELSDRQMTGLKGGYFCVCGAVYAASYQYDLIFSLKDLN